MSKRFTSHGMTHRVEVIPNKTNTHWLFSVSSMGGQGLALVPESEARELAELILAGLGEPNYTCKTHKKIGTCLECLR